jgi:hypothetical protein
VLRGTAQNPDAFFQGREAANLIYAACPGIVQKAMDEFAEQTGRSYNLFDYVGSPNAESVIVLMGSGCEAAHEAVEYFNGRGSKLGLLKVRLYRPFDGKRFVESLPASVRRIAVLDCRRLDGLRAANSAGRGGCARIEHLLHSHGFGYVRPGRGAQVSTGDVFRAAKCLGEGEQTPAIRSALGFMRRGDLVSDDTVLSLVGERARCLRCRGGF